MKKKITTIVFTVFVFLGFSQEDSLDLYTRKAGIFPGYVIAYPQGDLFRVEQYMDVKGNYWVNRFVFTAEKLAKETKHMAKKRVAPCDSMVNVLRNSSYLGRESYKLDSMARKKLGYTHEFFRWNIERELNINLNQCADEYREAVQPGLDVARAKIDSAYQAKEKLYRDLVSGSFSFDHGGMMTYLLKHGNGGTDYKIYEWLILNDTRKFVSVIEKMEENQFYNFTFLLDYFPAEGKVDEMKAGLKALDFGGTRKNKVIKTLRHRRQPKSSS